MKVLFKALGALVFLSLVAMIVIPFVVDVDKYRPEIVDAANQNLNGKLELGKLSLSLWGQIKVQVDGVTLKDAHEHTLVAVKDAFFHIPFSSMLGGAPLITFKMEKPEVNVLKDKSGKINLMGLLKPSSPSGTLPLAGSAAGSAKAQATSTSQPSTATTQRGSSELPSIAVKARLGIEIRDAALTYKDEATGLSSQVNNLNFIVRDLSLSRPTDFEIWADLNTTMGKSMSVKGPAKLSARSELMASSGAVNQLAFTFKMDLDDLEILIPGTFEKHRGIAADASGSFVLSQKQAVIKKFDVRFHNAEMQVEGVVANLNAEAAPGTAPSAPLVKVSIKSNPIALAPWNELVPAMKSFELGGTAQIAINLDGPVDHFGYLGDLTMTGFTMKSPGLKSQPSFDAAIQLSTDQIDHFQVSMKAPGNDLHISGKVIGFKTPHVDMTLASSGMDLDQLMEFAAPAKKAGSEKAEPAESLQGASNGSGAAAHAQDLDSSLDSLRDNPTAAATVASINVNLRSLQAHGVKMTDVLAQLSMRDLTFAVESFSMGLLNGKIKSSFAIAMKPKIPNYHFNADIGGLDLAAAVASQMRMFKNTLVGRANFKIEGSGSSLNPESAKKNLNAKGSFKVESAAFASVDVGRMAAEGLSKTIDGLSSKIPALKGKGPKALGNQTSKYDWVSSTFAISGGQFNMPDFQTKAVPNQGIDLKGTTQVNLVSQALNAHWEVIDTYDLLKVRSISVDQQGIKADHLLAEGSGPVKFPVTVTGTTSNPQFSYVEMAAYLTRVALGNVAGGAKAALKSDVGKRALEKIAPNAPAPVQNALKKLFGG